MDVKSIIKLIPGFKPTPKSGTVSTIQKSASAFVKRRKQTGAKSVMPVKKAMGGEASEGVARAGIRKGIRDRKRKELMDSLERLRKKGPRIKPKKKPKKPKRKMTNKEEFDIFQRKLDQRLK
jgi:hypothetical protein